ncbi:hypothetical protein HDG34_001203 [Paraburkholderia sp. HC6.4b]|nr:hypothetical protein [Paraburkholderia sp. HC6.4b]MBB5449677.1 hypothetical protein [Paraburkholderia sp. Kb1A]
MHLIAAPASGAAGRGHAAHRSHRLSAR